MDRTKIVDIICKQTNYTKEEAEQKLMEFDNDLEKVILDYMGGSKIKDREISNNQKIFKAFRDLY
jgi:hypothetical protein